MWAQAIGIGIGTWAAGIGAVAAAQRRLIFKPPTRLRTLPPGPAAGSFDVEALALQVAPGVTLEGWRSRPRDGSAPRATLLYFGGRGENAAWAPQMSGYLPGWSVLAFNYRGFGASLGRATEAAVCADALRIHELCGEAAPLAIMGRSLGTAVAIRLAGAVRPRALVLVSPFDSLGALAAANPLLAPGVPLLRHRFDTRAQAPQVRCPTLVLLARGDRRVPRRRSLALLRRLGTTAELAEFDGQTHRSLPRSVAAQTAIAAFLVPA
ncbi:MAG: alpha/beta hydrolase [Burkholderiales bacterium]|nr:alpha/beta hydrolase [Burkholderiales bacterium]MDE1927573.1 alpha/beta hydrolase [Burkholderiales bacterium]MDE2160884.1 alpha/beta hydrolase [Burkholderiales bacterium]MDE2505188.1 alpha/beta hydrolase [Burkholderiales bacterium]